MIETEGSGGEEMRMEDGQDDPFTTRLLSFQQVHVLSIMSPFAQWCQHVEKVSGPENTSEQPNLSEVCFLALFLWL